MTALGRARTMSQPLSFDILVSKASATDIPPGLAPAHILAATTILRNAQAGPRFARFSDAYLLGEFVAQRHLSTLSADGVQPRLPSSQDVDRMITEGSVCAMTLTDNTPWKKLFSDSGVDIEIRRNSQHQRAGAQIEEKAVSSAPQAPPCSLANISTNPHVTTPEMAWSTVRNLSAITDNSELNVSEVSDIIVSALYAPSFDDGQTGDYDTGLDDFPPDVACPSSSQHLPLDIVGSSDVVQENTEDTSRSDPVHTSLAANLGQIGNRERKSEEELAPFPEFEIPKPEKLEMFAKILQTGIPGFVPMTPKVHKRIADIANKTLDTCRKKCRHYDLSMCLIGGSETPENVKAETAKRGTTSVFNTDSEGAQAHTAVCVERTQSLSASAIEALINAATSPTTWCRSPRLLSRSQSLSEVFEVSCDEEEITTKVDRKGKGVAKETKQKTTNNGPEDYFNLASISTKEKKWKENEPAEMPKLRTPLKNNYYVANINLDGAQDTLEAACAVMVSSALYESDTSIHSIKRKTMDWLDHELAKNISEDEKAISPTSEQKEEVENVDSPVKKDPPVQEYAPVWDSDSDEEKTAKLIVMPIANKPLNIPVKKQRRRERQAIIVNRPPDDPFKPKLIQRDFPNAPSLAGDIGPHRKSHDSWPPASNQQYEKVEKIDWYSQTRSPNRSSSSRPMSPRLRYSGRPSMARASTNQSEGGFSTFTENSAQGSPPGRATHPEQSEPVGVMSPTTERKPSTKHVSFSRGEQIFSFDDEEDGRLEFCGVCKKRHIEPGPPSMLPQRDTCLSMLPQYFPRSRYPGEEWKEFIRRTNEHLRICQALDGHGDLVVKTNDWGLEYHDRSPDWEKAGRTGGWWKCRVGSEDPKVHKVERECKKCIQHAIQREQAIERGRRNKEGNVSPIERARRDPNVQGQSAEAPLYRLRKAKWESERWTERYMRIEMEEDRRFVVERMKRRGY